jgi:hypothetical protein
MIPSWTRKYIGELVVQACLRRRQAVSIELTFYLIPDRLRSICVVSGKPDPGSILVSGGAAISTGVNKWETHNAEMSTASMCPM